MRNVNRGSITIWLSLIICVILSLVFACIISVRISTARAYMSICMEESLFSEFARYDRILYDRYGLLVMDGGFGSGDINFAAVAKEIEDAAQELVSENEDLFRLSLKETDITGYVCAADNGAAALRSQINSLMAVKLGADGIERLSNMVGTNAPIISQQEENGTVDPDTVREAYEQQEREAAARRAEAEAAEAAAEEAGESETESSTVVEVPEDFVNPIDNINNIIRMGIYNTILPDPTGISNRAIDTSSLAVNRTFQTGMGFPPEDADNAAGNLFMAAYITDFFPNFLSGSSNEGLKYQAEFAIAGRGSDAENLKSVLNRLLLIRLGLNLLYLEVLDETKKAEAEAMALIISSVLLMPESSEGIAQILLFLWAYAESMMDLKTLLEGGREPVIKDESTWQLSLEQMASFSRSTPTDKNRSGLSYKDHLVILLCMQSEGELAADVMNLLEYNRRLIGNEPGFKIDSCLTAVEAEMLVTIDDMDFSIRRSYGYYSPES